MAASHPRSEPDLAARVAEVPFWYHSIELGNGVVTPGLKPLPGLRLEAERLSLPDLRGKTVLDIGAWDGFFSFEAERRGAARVLALDHFVWSIVFGPEGAPPPGTPGTWQPETLPGKRGFDLARATLGSRVEDRVDDFMSMDVEELGAFDVVLYLGVLYHITDPFEALRRVARVTGDLAVIETQAIVAPGYESDALCEVYPGRELNDDPTNWWAPNAKALEAMCAEAGFARTEWKQPPPPSLALIGGGIHRCRVVLHAYKDNLR